MNFVNVDVVVDAAESLYHCCCNVDDDLVWREDDRVYLKSKNKIYDISSFAKVHIEILQKSKFSIILIIN